MIKQTFKQWLAEQTKRDDPVGDLANDTERVVVPDRVKTYKQWESFISWQGAGEPAQEALKEAWAEYKLSKTVKRLI